ncbi:polyprenyl synthetase family protein [Dyadobacter sp. CY399]|uniref:Polyprenyl synthetase family protein n=1 Tax=Dyadobacter fanqingshengii TaxID=2906443 RepID=A0A9X1PCE1_9BACT|nr:polyprenyl synthetase family protein [Dyadobacter fanqingshengii]MCF0042386.1 polyprenyl synthetase family protein [Dyadobacter fanqingshengii]USJ35088.1 polyprenyl synthetase family protein [Dyadobacter fanqingshengii]
MIKPEQLLRTLQIEFEKQSYGEHPIELYEPIRYIMSLGGKRFRPLLTLLAASIYSDNWENAIKPAMAVEVFHNFTLMHDDIMDQAPLRRGKPTVHEKWNANTAILSGDVMLIKAYDLLLDIPAEKLRRVLERFNKTAAEVCEGQQLDMNFEIRWDVTEEEYLGMIRLKTSVLLGFALELGGIIGGADEESIQLLYSAGENMGIGFQLKDDLLDVYGDPDKFGKQVGGDIISNKKTFLLIEALSKADNGSKAELDRWIGLETFDKQKKVAAITAIYENLGIRAFTEQKIQEYFTKGLSSLHALKIDERRKEPLLQFAEQLVEREK